MWAVARAVGLVLLAGASGTAIADDGVDDTAIEIHGFASQGALWTSANNYLANTEDGSFELAEAGLNFTKPLGDRLRFGLQLFTRDLGPLGDYQANVDWFQLDYRWKDWLGLRAGRVKLAYGLYNDTSDIDAAHPVALLPQSVYSLTNREILLAQTGVELYGYKPLGKLGALDYRGYAGTVHIPFQREGDTGLQRLEIPYVAGGRVMWETPEVGLRVGVSGLAGMLAGELAFPGVPDLVAYDVRVRLWLASIEYITGPFLFAAEYGRGWSRADASPPLPAARVSDERMYGLAAYRLNDWLQLAAYYSAFYPDRDDRVGRERRQHDAAATVRFDLNTHWLLKLEAHHMRGTALLNADLNDGRDPSMLRNQWWMLVAKTTVYF